MLVTDSADAPEDLLGFFWGESLDDRCGPNLPSCNQRHVAHKWHRIGFLCWRSQSKTLFLMVSVQSTIQFQFHQRRERLLRASYPILCLLLAPEPNVSSRSLPSPQGSCRSY